MERIEKLLQEYGKAVRARIEAENERDEAVAPIKAEMEKAMQPFLEQIEVVGDPLEGKVGAAKVAEKAARYKLEVALRTANVRRRITSDSGEWAQRSVKTTAKVVDIPQFLRDPLAPRIATQVKINQDAARQLLLTGEIPGVEQEDKDRISVHVEKEI